MVGYGKWRDGGDDWRLKWVIYKTGGDSPLAAISEAPLNDYVGLGPHSRLTVGAALRPRRPGFACDPIRDVSPNASLAPLR